MIQNIHVYIGHVFIREFANIAHYTTSHIWRLDRLIKIMVRITKHSSSKHNLHQDNALNVSKRNCDNSFHLLAYESDNVKSHLM